MTDPAEDAIALSEQIRDLIRRCTAATAIYTGPNRSKLLDMAAQLRLLLAINYGLVEDVDVAAAWYEIAYREYRKITNQ